MLHFRLKMTDIESQTSTSGRITTQDNTIDGNPRPLNKLENQVETEAASQVPRKAHDTPSHHIQKKENIRTAEKHQNTKRKRNRDKSKYRNKR